MEYSKLLADNGLSTRDSAFGYGWGVIANEIRKLCGAINCIFGTCSPGTHEVLHELATPGANVFNEYPDPGKDQVVLIR